MKKIILVTGGARSGKSRYALSLAEPQSSKAYLATAEPLDSEMQARIDKHRSERPASFATYETPVQLPLELRTRIPHYDFILVDCLTLWLSNLLVRQTGPEGVETQIDDLVKSASQAQGTVVFVTNELGMGLVPDSRLGRDFRDWQGLLNQKIADICHEVIFMVSGLPLFLKKEERVYESL